MKLMTMLFSLDVDCKQIFCVFYFNVNFAKKCIFFICSAIVISCSIAFINYIVCDKKDNLNIKCEQFYTVLYSDGFQSLHDYNTLQLYRSNLVIHFYTRTLK